MYRKVIIARSWTMLLGIDVDGMLRFSDDGRRRRLLGTHLECFVSGDGHVPLDQFRGS
jgi:hypothetical protein